MATSSSLRSDHSVAAGRVAWLPVLLLFTLTGCGGRAASDAMASSAGMGGSGVGGSRAAGMAGMPQAPIDEPLPSDVAGRWGLFEFEDPVGVQLIQSDGVLSGRGCAAGAPPEAPGYSSFCGDISGKVEESEVFFVFNFEFASYAAFTTVSKDGQRMTGRFHGVQDFLPYPTAWLRVPDDQSWLEYPVHDADDPLAGLYELRLQDASAGASEYSADKVYSFRYYEGAIASDLGSFWNSEISRAEPGGPFTVGPVPATAPELAISMSMEVGEQGFTQVRATTASGHAYVFAAARTL